MIDVIIALLVAYTDDSVMLQGFNNGCVPLIKDDLTFCAKLFFCLVYEHPKKAQVLLGNKDFVKAVKAGLTEPYQHTVDGLLAADDKDLDSWAEQFFDTRKLAYSPERADKPASPGRGMR